MMVYAGLFILVSGLLKKLQASHATPSCSQHHSRFSRDLGLRFMSLTKQGMRCARAKHPAMLRSHSAGRHRSGK